MIKVFQDVEQNGGTYWSCKIEIEYHKNFSSREAVSDSVTPRLSQCMTLTVNVDVGVEN